MAALRSLLLWNVSVRDPAFLLAVLCIIAVFTVLFIERPRLYLPMMLATAPLPKLFTMGGYMMSNAMTAAPGFSVVDMVLAAGTSALLFHGLKRTDRRESQAFGRAMKLWAGTVALSVLVGLTVWSDSYRKINVVYATRYLITLVAYATAVQYGLRERSDFSLRKMLHILAVTGNLTVALGLVYYFTFGSSGGGARAVLLTDPVLGTGFFRTYLWFFDYGNDMGFYAATIGVLNVIMLSDRRVAGWRLLNAAGLLGCAATVLLIGERANVLVISVALVYFIWETTGFRHRSVRVTILFQIACLLAVVLAGAATMTVVAPEFMTNKFHNSTGTTDLAVQQSAISTMTEAGVPNVLATLVASLPFGDLTFRLALNLAGVWYFFAHPYGVGFWGELDVAGFWSHHEIVKIAEEQGVFGLAALVLLIVRLKRLLWSGKGFRGPAGQLGVLLRSISVGLFAAMLGANSVLLGMKFPLVYWSLLGVWSALPRGIPQGYTAIRQSAPPPQRETARV